MIDLDLTSKRMFAERKKKKNFLCQTNKKI